MLIYHKVEKKNVRFSFGVATAPACLRVRTGRRGGRADCSLVCFGTNSREVYNYITDFLSLFSKVVWSIQTGRWNQL
ncbi:TPA: hypothetical protein DIS55_03715 [Candidatus Kaiserbacteria bacterium]|nr:hypothetical protein [Candidatus Kaiserbacteria bacterium]